MASDHYGTCLNDQTPTYYNYKNKKIIISSSDHHHVFASATAPNSNPFFGSGGIVSFGVNRPETSFFQPFGHEEDNGDQYFDEYFNHQSDKKKKLSTDQLQFLEKSFELDNKLEPDRKAQLANELGLKPRQIAIWFQNRRARWKNKRTETDYEALHASYTALKNDYDNLVKENEKLKTRVLHFKRDTRPSNAMSRKDAIPDITSDNVDYSKVGYKKNEEQCSLRSDDTNVETPRLTNNGIYSFLANSSGDSCSHLFDPGQSDLSQICHVPANSCYFGFPVEDHAFSFWSH